MVAFVADLEGLAGGRVGLAEYLGYHRSSIGKWLTGCSSPNIKTVARLAAEFRLLLDDYVTEQIVVAPPDRPPIPCGVWIPPPPPTG